MTRMPGADWRPVRNHTPGGVTRPPRGMVVHTAVTPATTQALDGVVNYFDSPSSQVSSYFVVGIDGHIAQCVDLDDRAWTQAAGNQEWVGVENIGDGTKAPLTDAQVAANARIFAFLHDQYGVPLGRTDDPVNGRGLGWHGMGGQAWGGHLICPGDYVKAQLATILAHAVVLVMGGNNLGGTSMARMVAHSANEKALITLNELSDGTGDQLIAQSCAPFAPTADGKVTPTVFHLSSPVSEIVATAKGDGVLCRFVDGHFDVAHVTSGTVH